MLYSLLLAAEFMNYVVAKPLAGDQFIPRL